MDILLTTYPRHKSKNVGDSLITDSAIKLVRYRVPSYDPDIYFREDSLEGIDKEEVRTILIPGFSVNNDTYPSLFKMYSDITDISNKIYVTGCSFQNLVANVDTYKNYEYNKETKEILQLLANSSGTIPCRDQLIHEMLIRNNIRASYIGDLALYDDEKITEKFVPPESVKSVAFTIQHNTKFLSQSKKLLSLIKREFSDSDLYVVHHSKPNKIPKLIADYAVSLGFIEKDISGDSEHLKFYEDIDLHIGYRLHGHIHFLRNRKPSFLMAEDCRSFGISKTGLLKTGIFEAMENDGISVRDVAPYELMKSVRSNIKSQYHDYNKLFSYIDEVYYECVRPFFDQFCIKIGWKISFWEKLGLYFRGFGENISYFKNNR
ncbi:polysaccharide pyruvyl transferase family protein [Billgrantia montanilacus]|uniref:Polysaccharide pyruvyl transferase family protein n=1 Tax=Billgrantia montanilacus TaxID=2282305 RepID=A0A368U2N2_9GAMM|nr:polysaccharide pyruvyl transferase family protein [Halomonas montanilacus]RCV89373.1 polysaccharide pyruvyl transferase family protein [Halomonas montanilacus]